MKFNWVREKYKKVKGVFLMTCYYTLLNGQRHSKIFLSEPRDIGILKAKVEKDTKALPNGAWEPIEGALWTVHPGGWATLEDSQIRMLA